MDAIKKNRKLYQQHIRVNPTISISERKTDQTFT